MKKMELDGKILKILCGVLIISLFAACKTNKGATAYDADIMKTEENFFSSVIDRSCRFNTLSARIKLEFEGRQKQFSSRASLKMIYNERLQLSIQPLLGIEMFFIEVGADSVKIVDRMNKLYMTDSYDNLKGETQIDFNFHNLQALFANQIFVPGENDISPAHFRLFRSTADRSRAEFKLKDTNGMFYTFEAGGNEQLLSTTISNGSGNLMLAWNYGNFLPIDNQRFPSEMTVRLSADGDIQGTVSLSFSTPEINSPINTDFNIPSGYKRVTMAQIINSLEIK
ncbi:MAG: DUF4292 domain-containing protein [Tannerella sp.]|jgi:hypothetical protein|nr:DUF4292 domain-containing protein [Tannerella sp.]